MKWSNKEMDQSQTEKNSPSEWEERLLDRLSSKLNKENLVPGPHYTPLESTAQRGFWLIVAKLYAGSAIDRMMATILNIFATERRVIGMISFNVMTKLMKNDPNQVKRSLSGETYSAFLARCHTKGIVTIVRAGSKWGSGQRDATVIEIVDPDLVRLLEQETGGTFENQKQSFWDQHGALKRVLGEAPPKNQTSEGESATPSLNEASLSLSLNDSLKPTPDREREKKQKKDQIEIENRIEECEGDVDVVLTNKEMADLLPFLRVAGLNFTEELKNISWLLYGLTKMLLPTVFKKDFLGEVEKVLDHWGFLRECEFLVLTSDQFFAVGELLIKVRPILYKDENGAVEDIKDTKSRLIDLIHFAYIKYRKDIELDAARKSKWAEALALSSYHKRNLLQFRLEQDFKDRMLLAKTCPYEERRQHLDLIVGIVKRCRDKDPEVIGMNFTLDPEIKDLLHEHGYHYEGQSF